MSIIHKYKYIKFLLALFILIALFCGSYLISTKSIPQNAIAANADLSLYVSTTGNDDYPATVDNPGSKDSPFKTIYKARNYIRDNKTGIASGNVTVNLRGGEYFLPETFKLEAQDSAPDGYTITYQSYPGENAVLSGGRKLTGWTIHDSTKNIYKSFVGTNGVKDVLDVYPRQMYVNGETAVRARSEENPTWLQRFFTETTAVGGFDTDQGVVVGDPDTTRQIEADGIVYGNSNIKLTGTKFVNDQSIPSQDISTWQKDLTELETVNIWNWLSTRCRITSLLNPYFHEDPECKDAIIGYYNGNNRKYKFWLENAYNLIDQENEWYYDKIDGYFYYKAPASFNFLTANIYTPQTNFLLDIQGVRSGTTVVTVTKVKNIAFKNLKLEYGAWSTINSGNNNGTNNYITNQAGVSASGFSPSQITSRYTDNILFESLDISKMGSAGIEFGAGATNNRLLHSNISKVAGGAVSIGGTSIVDNNNTRLSLRFPSLAGDFTQDNVVYNNKITTTGETYHDQVGVLTVYAGGTIIKHNDISDTSYSGMSVGWGWGAMTSTQNYNNIVQNNKVDDTMKTIYDGAAIYLNGVQPNTKVENNYIGKISANSGSIYTDEGTTFSYIRNNLIESTNLGQYPDRPWLNNWTYTPSRNIIQRNFYNEDYIRNNPRNNNFASGTDLSTSYARYKACTDIRSQYECTSDVLRYTSMANSDSYVGTDPGNNLVSGDLVYNDFGKCSDVLPDSVCNADETTSEGCSINKNAGTLSIGLLPFQAKMCYGSNLKYTDLGDYPGINKITQHAGICDIKNDNYTECDDPDTFCANGAVNAPACTSNAPIGKLEMIKNSTVYAYAKDGNVSKVELKAYVKVGLPPNPSSRQRSLVSRVSEWESFKEVKTPIICDKERVDVYNGFGCEITIPDEYKNNLNHTIFLFAKDNISDETTFIGSQNFVISTVNEENITGFKCTESSTSTAELLNIARGESLYCSSTFTPNTNYQIEPGWKAKLRNTQSQVILNNAQSDDCTVVAQKLNCSNLTIPDNAPLGQYDIIISTPRAAPDDIIFKNKTINVFSTVITNASVGTATCTPNPAYKSTTTTYTNCIFPLTGSPSGVYTLPPVNTTAGNTTSLAAGIVSTNGQTSGSGVFLGNSDPCTISGSTLVCNNISIPSNTNIGSREIIIHQPNVGWFMDKGFLTVDLPSPLIVSDIPSLTVTCGDPVGSNSITSCSFVLPSNKSLPSDFKISIGGGGINPSQTCAPVVGSTTNQYTCNNIPTPNSIGAIPISGNLGTGGSATKTATGETSNVTGINFGNIDWQFTPNQGGTAPLFGSSNNTTITVKNFKTPFDSTPTSNTRYKCTLYYRSINDRNMTTSTWTPVNQIAIDYNATTGCSFNITKAMRVNKLNHSLKLIISEPNALTTSPNTDYTFYNEYIYRFQGAGVASGG